LVKGYFVNIFSLSFSKKRSHKVASTIFETHVTLKENLFETLFGEEKEVLNGIALGQAVSDYRN
jgi:hypothetical protein